MLDMGTKFKTSSYEMICLALISWKEISDLVLYMYSMLVKKWFKYRNTYYQNIFKSKPIIGCKLKKKSQLYKVSHLRESSCMIL